MAQRIKFKCCNCEQVYSLLRDVKGQPRLIEECPFCGQECVAELAPYRSEITSIYKGKETDAHELGEGFNLPDVLPTTKPEE